MDVLVAMQVFRRVVELGAFSKAARDLRLSNAAVSKHVAALEDRLSTKLLNRTTRRLSLTTAGSAYFERCTPWLDDLGEIEGALTQSKSEPSGVLRVNAPMSFSLLHLSPLLPKFLDRYPQLKLDVGFTDRFVDVVEEGVDVVVRIATSLPDSATLLVQRLARTRHRLVASPAYLRAHGEPKSIAALASHHCLSYSLSRTPGVWELMEDGKVVRVHVDARLVLNNSIGLRDAAIAGQGITLVPAFYVGEAVRKRQLRTLLDEHTVAPLFVYAAYQRSRHLSAKVRLFVEHLRNHFAKADWAIRDR
ncbi:MAG: LysR family transcriptional regulator [Polyangiaceae bacterium]